jgi:hypothetical protein
MRPMEEMRRAMPPARFQPPSARVVDSPISCGTLRQEARSIDPLTAHVVSYREKPSHPASGAVALSSLSAPSSHP